MGRRAKKSYTKQEELDHLLGNLRCELGFFLYFSASDLLGKTGHMAAGEFAAAVLRAQGMIPEYEKKWVRELEKRFHEKFGSHISVEGE